MHILAIEPWLGTKFGWVGSGSFRASPTFLLRTDLTRVFVASGCILEPLFLNPKKTFGIKMPQSHSALGLVWHEAEFGEIPFSKVDRGIVLSNDIKVDFGPYNVVSSAQKAPLPTMEIKAGALSENDLIFAMTFFDVAAWPVQRGISINETSPLAELLQEERLLYVYWFDLYGPGRSGMLQVSGKPSEDGSPAGVYEFGGSDVPGFIKRYRASCNTLSNTIVGNWTLHSNLSSFSNPESRKKHEGVELLLLNSVPIIDSIDDHDRFLRWREDRRTERRRFADEVSRVSVEVAVSETPNDKLAEIICDIYKAAEDLARLAGEKDFGVNIGSYRVVVDTKDYEFRAHLRDAVPYGLGAASLAHGLGLSIPLLGALATGYRLAEPTIKVSKRQIPAFFSKPQTLPFVNFMKNVSYSP